MDVEMGFFEHANSLVVMKGHVYVCKKRKCTTSTVIRLP